MKLRPGVSVVGGKAVAIIANIAVISILARALPPEHMGAFWIATNTLAFWVLLSTVGMERSIVKELSVCRVDGSPALAQRICDTSLTSVLATSGLSAMALYVLTQHWLGPTVFKSGPLTNVAAILSGVLFFRSLNLFLSEMFRGQARFTTATAIGMTVPPLIFLAGAAAYLSTDTRSLAGAMSLQGIGFFIPATWGIWLFVRAGGSLHVDTRLLRQSYVVALPVMLAQIAQFLFANFDLWYVGAAFPQHDVAIYGGAKRLVNQVNTTLIIVNAIIPTFVAELFRKGDREALERTLRSAATFAAIPSLAMLIVFLLLPNTVMRLMLGPFYAEGGSILAILACGQIANVLASTAGVILSMSGLHREYMKALCLALCISALLILGMGRTFGLLGVAAAFGFTFWALNIWMVWFIRRRLGVLIFCYVRPRSIVAAVSGTLRPPRHEI